MKEQLISFDTAKLTKEKGFSQKTDNFYRNNGVLVGKQGVSSGLVLPVKSGINRQVAPTQSLLQKWLRENHEIFVTVSIPYEEFGNYAAEIWGRNKEDGIKKLLLDGMTVFESYSKALEEGLVESLKLIKKK